MKNVSAKQRFENALQQLARSSSLWTVFTDFLDFSLHMMRWLDLKNENFSVLEKKYPQPEQAHLFAEAYMAIGDIADNEGTGFKDPFGDFYMEHLSNGNNGQFFTPEHICDMIALMQMGTSVKNDATVADPCCGSGRMLLAAAKINRNCLFYGADIDLVCCKMTVLNFLLNTLCGEVTWMNTLTMDRWKTWRINKVMDSNGFYRPYYLETIHNPEEELQMKEHVMKGSAPMPTIKQIIKEKILDKAKTNSSQLFLFGDVE
ncbi:MAG: N-6 DNA methylase [Chitinophagaceae bacterium]